MARTRFAKGQGHLLRDEILDVTVTLLQNCATADEITIRTIAAAVQRTTPQIYEHFANRDEVLHEAAKRALNDMAISVDKAVGRSTDFRKRLRARAHAYVNFAIANPAAYRVLFMPSTPSPMTVDALLLLAGMEAVVKDLDAAYAAQRLAWTDRPKVALTLWSALHGVASLHVAHPQAVWPTDMLDQLLDELAQGLIPRPSEK
jgi:AcrR family transcriptional regulator